MKKVEKSKSTNNKLKATIKEEKFKNKHKIKLIKNVIAEKKERNNLSEDKNTKKNLWNDLEFYKVAANIKQCPIDNLPEVVFAGRSNAGKSSLVNAFANKKKLAKVSQTPGKTQLLVYFKCRDLFYLTDLPGYGFTATGHSKSVNFMSLANNYFEANPPRPIALVLLVLDARHLPSAKDILMHEYLQAKNLPYVILLNKIDKLSKNEINKNKINILKHLRLAPTSPCFPISANTQYGIYTLKKYIEDVVIHKNIFCDLE